MKLAVRMMPLMVAAALAGCVLPSESHWIGSSVMNVHWEQYEFVDPVCRKMHPIEPIDSDPPQFITGCYRVMGHDCHIYTNDGRTDVVAGFVKECFDKLQTGTKSGKGSTRPQPERNAAS
jgi:hypothetical protein